MMRSNGIWVAAQVVRIGTKGMLLRYEVDNNVWEKVISLNSQSVAAFGTHVKPVAVAAREEKPKPKPKEKEKDEETESVVSRNSRSSRTSRQSNASRKNSKAKRESSRSRKSSKS
jgi:acyl-CoA hydrolase